MAVMAYLGFAIEKYYKNRHGLVSDFYEFLQYASREIQFLKTDILTLISNFNSGRAGAFSKVLESVKESVQKGEEIKIDNPFLNASEKLMVSGFFLGISKSDYCEQEKVFKRYLSETESKLKQTEKQKKNNGELIKKLFILIGVGILIILI